MGSHIVRILALVVQFLAQAPRRIVPLSTWAARPDPANHLWGFIYFTDVAGGSLWRANSTRWVPVSGRLVMRQVNTDLTTSATASEVALDQFTMPAGMADANSNLICEVRPATSGNTNAKRLYLRGGGTGVDGSILSQVNIASASTVAGWFVFGFFCRASATLKKGFGSGVSGQSSTAMPNVSLDSATAIDYFLTAQKDVAGDTVTIAQVRWIYEKGAA